MFPDLMGVWGMPQRGAGDYLCENLAFITSPKVAQMATLMKSCSWFKRAIVSLTFVLTKNSTPNLVKLLLSFRIFIAVQLSGPHFFTFHSFSLYW